MRKTFFALITAVAVGFISAVGLCVRALLAPQPVFSLANESMKIVVDAGHGGIDGGVTGIATGVKESDINLAVAMMLKNSLEELGFEVVLTRKTEGGLYGTPTKGFKRRDMEKRKEIIQKASPALVISVHQNRYPAQSVRGGQVFFKTGDSRGEQFALGVQERLNGLYAEQGVKARKATPADYYLLNCSSAPSIIVECGFLSNAKDEALILDGVWKRRLADSVTAGVMDYFSSSLA